MRKFGLGIIVVVLVQISFGIYMTYQTGAELTAAAVSTNVPVPSRHAESAAVIREDTPAAADAFADPFSRPVVPAVPTAVDVRHIEAMPVSYALELKAVGRPSSRPRPMKNDVRTGPETTIAREYFGGMVVERRYGGSPVRPKRRGEVVSRRFFGNLVVERRFDLSVQTAVRSRSNKNVYIASYVPNTKPRLIISKG